MVVLEVCKEANNEDKYVVVWLDNSGALWWDDVEVMKLMDFVLDSTGVVW